MGSQVSQVIIIYIQQTIVASSQNLYEWRTNNLVLSCSCDEDDQKFYLDFLVRTSSHLPERVKD